MDHSASSHHKKSPHKKDLVHRDPVLTGRTGKRPGAARLLWSPAQWEGARPPGTGQASTIHIPLVAATPTSSAASPGCTECLTGGADTGSRAGRDMLIPASVWEALEQNLLEQVARLGVLAVCV